MPRRFRGGRRSCEGLRYGAEHDEAIGARLGWGGMLLGPAGEPAQQHPPPSGSKEEVGASPASGLPSVPGCGSVPGPLLPPSPGESGHRSRGQAGEVSAARRLLRWWSRQQGQGETRLLPQDSGRRVSPSRAGPSLEATACVPAAGLRSMLHSPHGASGESASPSHRASAPHRLRPFACAPTLPGGALVHPRRRHPRPTARRLAELGS
ncbi:hypothetical protein NDU88_005481 [Pleurodeles waltl]|uniref:Uncharacterized protein n=1 Tax=Pleurodeles waltl TaxID=8319 RepID=A0AAV7UL68_PLEWA|nr:hypothetical protein NDU88_005481 [Pleurodeles waltl]